MNHFYVSYAYSDMVKHGYGYLEFKTEAQMSDEGFMDRVRKNIIDNGRLPNGSVTVLNIIKLN